MRLDMQRLDKILSEAGICSRRDCERLVRKRLILVNDSPAVSAASKIPDDAVISVDGMPVVRRRRMVCIMNKRAALVTSTDDPQSPTVMDDLPDEMLGQLIVPAGRLDKDTEGLLVFTNDGALLHRLISPKSEVTKEYYIEYDGTLQADAPEKAKTGITLKDGSVCKSADLVLLQGGKCTICIREGMYHQVKRMIAALGGHVTFLRRTRIGALEIGDLKPGEVRELSEKETENLFL